MRCAQAFSFLNQRREHSLDFHGLFDQFVVLDGFQ